MSSRPSQTQVNKVRSLRDGYGLTWAEIGREMGIAGSTARLWWIEHVDGAKRGQREDRN